MQHNVYLNYTLYAISTPSKKSVINITDAHMQVNMELVYCYCNWTNQINLTVVVPKLPENLIKKLYLNGFYGILEKSSLYTVISFTKYMLIQYIWPVCIRIAYVFCYCID